MLVQSRIARASKFEVRPKVLGMEIEIVLAPVLDSDRVKRPGRCQAHLIKCKVDLAFGGRSRWEVWHCQTLWQGQSINVRPQKLKRDMSRMMLGRGWYRGLLFIENTLQLEVHNSIFRRDPSYPRPGLWSFLCFRNGCNLTSMAPKSSS